MTGIEEYNALIRFYFKMKPPTNIDEWGETVKHLLFALDFDGKRKQSELTPIPNMF